MTDNYPTGKRNKVRRQPARGHYDKVTINAILDSAFLCHIGFCIDGQPFVIPTAYGREGDSLYLHGSPKSRMMMHLASGAPCCLSVTCLDGLVLARSAYHHSMNYRSATIFGTATQVDGEEKVRAMAIISEQILKGRWAEVRPPNELELKATLVLKIAIGQASAKVRTGPPNDEKDDYELPVWAGVLPVHIAAGEPEPDPLLKSGTELADSVKLHLRMTASQP